MFQKIKSDSKYTHKLCLSVFELLNGNLEGLFFQDHHPLTKTLATLSVKCQLYPPFVMAIIIGKFLAIKLKTQYH